MDEPSFGHSKCEKPRAHQTGDIVGTGSMVWSSGELYLGATRGLDGIAQ